MHVVNTALGAQEQTLTPRSIRVRTAIPGYRTALCPARLISPRGHRGHEAGLTSALPACLHITNIKNHTENEGKCHEMSLYFNFFLKVKASE